MASNISQLICLPPRTMIFPGITPVTALNGSGNGNITSTECYVYANNGENVNSKCARFDVDVTDYKYINIKGEFSSQGGVHFSNTSQKNRPRCCYGYYIWYGVDSSLFIYRSNDYRIKWDVSSYTGIYFIFACAYTNDNGFQYSKVTEISLSNS